MFGDGGTEGNDLDNPECVRVETLRVRTVERKKLYVVAIERLKSTAGLAQIDGIRDGECEKY